MSRIHRHSMHSSLLLFQLRPRCSIVCDVLLHGHARNGAADHVESQVLRRFEADATFTHVELLAALLVFVGEPGLREWVGRSPDSKIRPEIFFGPRNDDVKKNGRTSSRSAAVNSTYRRQKMRRHLPPNYRLRLIVS